jgi:hypothetical protein
MELIDSIAKVAAGRPLVDAGAIGKSVRDNSATSRKCGLNGLFKVVASRCGKKKNFSFSRPTIWVARQDQLANFFGTRAATWFAGQDNFVPLYLKRFGQSARLGGFTRPIDTFECYELALRHID